jgi:hypothetical protein
MTRTERPNLPRICQGDIIRDVSYLDGVSESAGVLEISRLDFPLVIVLTQDCELEQEHQMRVQPARNQDKWLVSVLVAPLYNAQHVYRGEHLSELNLAMQPINQRKTPGTFLRNNDIPRYHYLEFAPEVPIVPSVIDFKHYFSVNAENLRERKKSFLVCMVAPLFREAVSHRFAAYLSRIGLPEPAAAEIGNHATAQLLPEDTPAPSHPMRQSQPENL